MSWGQNEDSISRSRKYSNVSNAATRQGGNENFQLYLEGKPDKRHVSTAVKTKSLKGEAGENNHFSNIPVCPCHRAFPCACTSFASGCLPPRPRSLPFCHPKASIPLYLLSPLICFFETVHHTHTCMCAHTHSSTSQYFKSIALFVNLSQKNMIQGGTVCTNTSFYAYTSLDASFLEDFPVPEDTIPYRLQLFSHSEKFAIQQQRRTITLQSLANPLYCHSSGTKLPIVLFP